MFYYDIFFKIGYKYDLFDYNNYFGVAVINHKKLYYNIDLLYN